MEARRRRVDLTTCASQPQNLHVSMAVGGPPGPLPLFSPMSRADENVVRGMISGVVGRSSAASFRSPQEEEEAEPDGSELYLEAAPPCAARPGS